MTNMRSSKATVFRVHLMLHCTKTNLSERKEIKFASPPQKVVDVQAQVESQFSIPKCVQVLSYNDQTLGADTELSAVRFREGDVFRVEYLSKGDCSDLLSIISWLEQLSTAISSRSSRIDEVIVLGIQQNSIENLRTYFSPWDDPTSTTYVNKLYFVERGGLEMILRIYQFLFMIPWNLMNARLKYLENWVIKSLWDFAETFPLRRLLIQHNILPMLTQSLLRVKLEEGKRIHDYDTSGNEYQQSLLVETIFGSIGTLLNLNEMPECQLEIATNRDILHQTSCFSLAPDLVAFCPQLIASFFGNLAFTPETHRYITDSVYIQRLLRACRNISQEEEDESLLKYFTILFLLQVCLISPHCIMQDWYEIITDLIESFLQSNSYRKIKSIEISRGFNCSIFIPYVKLAYVPTAPQSDGLLGRLQLVCLQMAIFALQNMLGREPHRELLLKEGLLDYVVCMPQYIPPSLRAQAEELVQIVVSSPNIPEGPPKLLNLVKAKLAKMHFGLDRTLSLSVSEIVTQWYTYYS